MPADSPEPESLAHVVFPLDADDWPPLTAERVWAERVGEDTYRIENTPWFVRNLAADDIVQAVVEDSDAWPVFVERLQWSGNYTIRVIPLRSGALAGNQQAVLDAFMPLGAYGETAGAYPIVALTLPPGADLRGAKDLLRQGEADGRWEYEEGCVDDAWLEL